MTSNTKTGSGWHGNRLRITAWTTAALILLLPFIAMQFSDEVNWDVVDFAFAGALLLSVGIPFELAVRKTSNTAYRAAVGVALVAAFIMVWANGAVGIIGSENNPANLMYYAVLAIGIAGALIVRFQSRGMARTLVATAVAQGGVAVIALIYRVGEAAEIVVVNGFFVALWLISARLFGNATREQPLTDEGLED
jgi:hypothetical protein